ncbi:MAG: transaldolase [Clostridiales bacterium]|nr:transaldolase [Clostridiales bacterium]
MRNECFGLREKLLFKTSVSNFSEEWENVRVQYAKEYENAMEQRKKEIIAILSELSIDMQSYLLRWNLQKPDNSEYLSWDIINDEANKNYNLLTSWGAKDKVEYIKAEVTDIKKSNLTKLSYMSDKNEINTRWGNDYASGLTRAIRRGGILVTTNPPLINMDRKNNPEVWAQRLEELKAANSGISSDKLVSLLTMKVVLENCKELRPIFEASEEKFGYVSLQINPKNYNDAVKMAEEIEFLYEELKKELNGTPNVVFKVPGTKASLDTVKRVTAKGIGVNITVSFSVDQHLAFAEVIEQGNAKVSFVVMMNGRLDDPIRDELQEIGLPDAQEVAKWGSTAIIRRSYDLLYRKNKYKKSAILTASLRGPWNIDASITDGEIPIFITSFPDKAEEYDSEKREIVSHIDEEIPAEILEKLMKSKLFKQAYEVGGLTVDGFDAYKPVIVTLDGFIKVYEELVEYTR